MIGNRKVLNADPVDEIEMLLDWVKAAPPEMQKVFVAKIKEAVGGGVAAPTPPEVEDVDVVSTEGPPDDDEDEDEPEINTDDEPKDNADETPVPKTNKNKVKVLPKAQQRGRMTMEEFRQFAPPEMVSSLDILRNNEKKERQLLANRILSKFTGTKRKDMATRVANKSARDLQDMLDLMGESTRSGNYEGAYNGRIDNAGEDQLDQSDMLLPTGVSLD